MTLGLMVLIILFSLVLIKSANMVIVGIRRISRETHTAAFAISAVILAVGTSLPELFVGVTSAIEGSPNLALGVVLGSNIANIALIGGLTAFIVGKVHIKDDYLKHEVGIAFLAGFLPIFLLLDNELNRVDGLILLSIYLAYATGFFRKRYIAIASKHREEGFVYRFIRQFNHIDSNRTKEFGRLFIGIALLLASADAIVKSSSSLAEQLGVPIFLIGLFIVAIGTSLPEFVFSLKSLREHEPSMFLGNLLGSTIANSTLIVGLVSVISPIKIESFSEYLVAGVAFIMVFLSFWFFIRTKHRLDRWEAGMLLILYISFVILELT